MGRMFDPYLSANYIVEIGDIQVGEFQEVSGLTNETEVATWEEGGENTYVHQFRGRNKYTNLVLKHGVTRLSPAIWAWREAMIHRKTPPMMDMNLVLLDDQGEEYTRWHLRNCQPVKWVGPDLKGGASEIAIETLEIAYDSFYIMEVTPPERERSPRDTRLRVRLSPERGAGIKGEAITFSCETVQGEPANDFKWTIDGQDVAGGQEISHTFPEVGQFEVKVTARNGNGEEDDGKGLAMVRPGPFKVDVDPPRKKVKVGEKVTFKANQTAGEPANRHVWTLSGGAPASGEQVEETFGTEGRFEVMLVAGNAYGQESQSKGVIEVEKAEEEPEVTLTAIGPGANQDHSGWVYYHHAMFYFELVLKNVKRVELSIAGGGSPSPYITGIWKQAQGGSVAAFNNQFDMGSPGKIEAPSTHNARCHYVKTVGAHPDKSIYDLINGRPKTYDFSAHDRWVIAIYSRASGTGTLTAKGLPPFVNTQKTPEVKAQVQWTMSGHQRPGD